MTYKFDLGSTYDAILARTTAYASFAVPLLLLTTGVAVKCATNFEQGLKPILKRSGAHPGATSRDRSRVSLEGDLDAGSGTELHPRMLIE